MFKKTLKICTSLGFIFICFIFPSAPTKYLVDGVEYSDEAVELVVVNWAIEPILYLSVIFIVVCAFLYIANE